MIFNLNILLIYLIFLLIIFLLSYTDKYCKEKICTTFLLLIIFHISISYIYNENFTSDSVKENDFILTKNDVLYIINQVKLSANDDNKKVIINSSLYNINLLYSKLASNIAKVIYISLINTDNIENMVNNNYNSFIDLIKSIDNMQLPEKIIQTNSNNIFITGKDNIFSNILLSYSSKVQPLNNNKNLEPIDNKTDLLRPNVYIDPNMTPNSDMNVNNNPNVNSDANPNSNANNNANNDNDMLNNLNMLKNLNLDNYDNNDMKEILTKAMNENSNNFKKSLDNLGNNNLKYNQTNNNLMKPLGQNTNTLSNKWSDNNEYTMLNTDKWTLQDSTPYKCKQTCEVCPVTDSKFSLLKNYENRVLNPDNINIDYIRDKLNS